MIYSRPIGLIILLSVLIALPVSAAYASDAPDYSDIASWAYYGEGEGKNADLFLICPTVDMGRNGNCNMSLDDESAKASFIGALNMERGIYEDYARMYAPFYRQMVFPLYEGPEEAMEPYLSIAYGDVRNAFLYYMENLNDGLPLILAGFSQGAQLALMLLEEFFSDDEYSARLIAAYCIGWRITEEDLAEYPHLRMAEGESDTGVIVSFNTEAPWVEGSIIVPEGVRTIGINPLSWDTGLDMAPRTLNEGACFTDYSGNIAREVPELTGAYLDEERGTLKAIDVNPEDYHNSLFPDGVYHLMDYQFFYRNLQENVGIRTAAWFGSNVAGGIVA